jgi:hypothetical protein
MEGDQVADSRRVGDLGTCGGGEVAGAGRLFGLLE